MSAGLKEYINGIVFTENQAFYGLHYLDSDGIRLAGEIVPFVNIERSYTLETTDNTTSQIAVIEIPDRTIMMLTAKVVARRTGGTSGADGDSLAYETKAAFKNVSGTAAQLGSTVNVFAEKDQVGWDVAWDVSGGNILIEVTGATDNDVTWLCQVTKHLITTIVDAMP